MWPLEHQRRQGKRGEASRTIADVAFHDVKMREDR